MGEQKKMLILRGNSGDHEDEDGNSRNYKRGALHEQPAKDYAKSRGYEGVVLDVSGETGADSAQTSQALIMLRPNDKGENEFTALYGFSGGGYNVLHILRALKEDERKRIELIVVLGAPPTVRVPNPDKPGKFKFVFSPTGSPQEPEFRSSNFKGAIGRWSTKILHPLPSRRRKTSMDTCSSPSGCLRWNCPRNVC